MMVRMDIAPEMLLWAGDRSGKTRESLVKAFPRLPEWEAGTTQPTFNQLESFARATYTPLGYFFLPEPPQISLPIPDLRTVGSERLNHPSPNLLDTIAICLDRQEWYRSFLIEQGEDPLPFVGSLSAKLGVGQAAEIMRTSLDFSLDDRAAMGTWEEALRTLAMNAESIGVLVMSSGVVGSDTHRKLDPDEFRGFALADDYAPVVFVNGADAKSAQIFTLIHELVHIWLGSSAVTNGGVPESDSRTPADTLEYWVNAVSAELLIPEDSIRSTFQSTADLVQETTRLSRTFKVSNAVVLRRLADLGLISWEMYRASQTHFESKGRDPLPAGGNFYNTAPVRASRRFTRAVVASTLEGRTLYRDAFRLLGFSSQKAFDGLSHELGLA
jgi:Zn-dependent peptidase ImmA (M78 family)